MRPYPIMLILEGQQTVVIGGGQVALRKAQSLVEAGALVTIVAWEIGDVSHMENVKIVRASYKPEHLAEAKLVYACTNVPALNAEIATEARTIGALVNCVDQPEDCDFFVPAVVSTGPVTVAIGTGGASPALAGRLKKCIAEALPERLGDFATALRQMRDEVKADITDIDRRGKILKTLASEVGYEAFLSGGKEALNRIVADAS